MSKADATPKASHDGVRYNASMWQTGKRFSILGEKTWHQHTFFSGCEAATRGVAAVTGAVVAAGTGGTMVAATRGAFAAVTAGGVAAVKWGSCAAVTRGMLAAVTGAVFALGLTAELLSASSFGLACSALVAASGAIMLGTNLSVPCIKHQLMRMYGDALH